MVERTPLNVDYEQIAHDLLRTLRGKRSQVAWSRRLGYRSNVAYAWESGRRQPTAAETLRAAWRSGIDLDKAMTQFYGHRPPWLDDTDPTSVAAVSFLLTDLKGQASVTELARRADLSRYSVTRWLSGSTQPKLPDFLRILEAASTRMVDFVACLVDPMVLPSVAPMWVRMEARRYGAAKHPWSQAYLRALELEDYLATAKHEDGWIAKRLGMPEGDEVACLAMLQTIEAVSWTGTHWKPDRISVDTRRHPEVSQQLKAHWTDVASGRIREGTDGQFSYNVFTISKDDLERIRELHLAYFHALRAIVAESKTDEVVAVANVQLFQLDTPP